jgi:hypothetical protein
MTCVHFLSFTGVTGHHSSSVKFFPLTLVFFYSTVLKSSFSKQDHDNSDVFTTIVFQNEVSSFPHTPSVDVVHCDHINTHLVRGFSQGAAMWWWPWVRTWLGNDLNVGFQFVKSKVPNEKVWGNVYHQVQVDCTTHKIDWSVCLLTLKHLVSLQIRTGSSVHPELDLYTTTDG